MANFVFANNIKTTVASAFSNVATSLTLASSVGLPTLSAGQVLPITINDAATGLVYEICYATAITGATLTVTRAQEGTAAQNWLVGDRAYCAPTALSVAPVNGNGLNVFQVANAVASNEAVPLAQAETLSTTGNAATATLATNAVNLTGSGTVSATTTGGAGLTPAIRSYLAGCGMSTVGGSSTMSIANGLAVDSSNSVQINVSAINKTTASWALGTNNGGLDTGVIAASTWYYFYAIYNATGPIVDVIFSSSSSSPLLPSGYTKYRYIGAGLTDGSSHWVSFTQSGREFYWVTPILDVASVAAGSVAVTATLNVPKGRKIKAFFGIQSQYIAYVSDLANADLAPSGTLAPIGTSGGGGSIGTGAVWTNTSGQVRYRSSLNGTFYISTQGWLDLADSQI